MKAQKASDGFVIDGLGFEFETDTGEKSLSIQDLDLDIKFGSVVAVLGASGSGKTTLLELLCGFKAPKSGKIEFEGRKVNQPESSIVMVFQDYKPALFPWKRVISNIELGRKKSDAKALCDKEHLLDLAESLDIKQLLYRRCGRLSGGQMQRVQIARAIYSDAKCIILDEPTSSLDVVAKQKFREFIKKLSCSAAFREKIIIYTTHDVRDAVYVSDEALLLTRLPETNEVKTKRVPAYARRFDWNSAIQDSDFDEIVDNVILNLFK